MCCGVGLFSFHPSLQVGAVGALTQVVDELGQIGAGKADAVRVAGPVVGGVTGDDGERLQRLQLIKYVQPLLPLLRGAGVGHPDVRV